MAAALMEELIEEVLLRFPPDDPASLVRAALVSKRWCRLIAGRGFRRRFRELHRAPPMLGFFCNVFWDEEIKNSIAHLVSTSSCLRRADHRGSQTLDSRHGRVLCYNPSFDGVVDPFVVWNLITGDHLQLPYLPVDNKLCGPKPLAFNATVLCAGSDACRHIDDDCHRRHFFVVFGGFYDDGMFIYVYSSESGAWREPSMVKEPHDFLDRVPAALVGNAVYFVFKLSMRILKFDLGTRENSIIDLPPVSYGRIILMTTEQGKLGFTRADDFKLYLWSMEVGAQGNAVWTQDRVIDLHSLLPASALLIPPDVVGCVHGRGVVLVGTGDGFFTVDPRLNQATKVGEGIRCKVDDDVDAGCHRFFIVVPYTSFYFPALGAVVPTVDEQKCGSITCIMNSSCVRVRSSK